MSAQNPKSDGERIHSVYWLHLPEHTDPFTQGYVGITYRKNRQKEHRDNRRFPAEHIFTVLAASLTRFEAAKMEWEHRKQRHIGWNTKKGGGKFIRQLLENNSLPGLPQPRINAAAITNGADLKRLDNQRLLQFAAAAVPVLRTLADLDQRMTYKQFGIAIGLVDQEWQPWHGRQCGQILDAVAAASRLLGEPLLDHLRVVNQTTGLPGAGADRNISIARADHQPASA
jgi:hypothetical protein